jgi:hypothetical protein
MLLLLRSNQDFAGVIRPVLYGAPEEISVTFDEKGSHLGSTGHSYYDPVEPKRTYVAPRKKGPFD